MIRMSGEETPVSFRRCVLGSDFAEFLEMYIVAVPPRTKRLISSLYGRDMWKYVDKIKSVLQYFDRHVSKGLVIKADDDGNEEINKLVEERLKRVSFERVRTHTGDIFFRRVESDRTRYCMSGSLFAQGAAE